MSTPNKETIIKTKEITFSNNTDYPLPATFESKAAFLEFANGYISDPSEWGNRYSQTISGIEIEWDAEEGWVEK